MSTEVTATSKTGEAFAKFQAADASTIATLSAEYQELASAIKNPEVTAIARIKALALIGEHGAQFDKSLTKATMQSIVQLLAEEDEQKAPIQLLVAAINAFVAICKNTTAKQEDLVCVGTDLCIQIILDRKGFPDQLRTAAFTGITELTTACFAGVAKKLLHLVSDDREKDEPEVVEAERTFALGKLKQFSRNPAHSDAWTDEVFHLLALVLVSCTACELQQLVSIANDLPAVKESGGAVLLDAILKANKIDKDPSRLYESLCIIGGTIPKATIHDAVAEKVMPMVTKTLTVKKGKKAADGEDDSVSIFAAKAVVLAAQTASVEKAAEMVPVLFKLLEKSIPACPAPVEETKDDAECEAADQFPMAENLTVVEAYLKALACVGEKSGATITEVLTAEATTGLVAKFLALHKTLSHYKKIAEFCIKKKVLDGASMVGDAEMTASIGNCIAMLGPLTTKHLPAAGLVPSWEKGAALPVKKQTPVAAQKRGRDRDDAKPSHGRSHSKPATKGGRKDTPKQKQGQQRRR